MIFLTGGSGLLGRHILEELRDRRRPVLALARSAASQAGLEARGAATLAGDVADPATWAAVQGVEAIVHSAAVIDSRTGWPTYERVNVTATRLAARRARELGVPLVHLSSVAVYAARAAAAPPGSVTEDAPTGSRSEGPFYPRSKRLAEDVVREEEGRGLRAVMLRPCVVYGEGDRLFLPNVARLARFGRFPLVGDGRRPLALVHARNVAGAVAAALDAPAAMGGVFNVTNDGEVTGLDFVAGLAAGLGIPVRAVRIPSALAHAGAAAADGVRRLLGPAFTNFRSAVRFLEGGNPYTSAAAVARLGWIPTVPHREGLPRAVRDILPTQ